MAGRFEGKTVLITGTAGGQGREAALLFASEGAKVVGCDLKVEMQQETLEMVKQAGGEMVAMAPLDLADDAQVRAWIDFAVENYGDFDVLYNNASGVRGGSIEQLTVEDWDFNMANELTNVFLACKHALPVFKRKGGGNIIITASIAGIVGAGMPGNTQGNLVHNVAKAAVLRLSENLAVELSPYNIRVNAVSPGMIDTPAIKSLLDAGGEELFFDSILIKRRGQPADIAKAAMFLASDDASYITGANLVVDGGWTASGGLGQPNPAVGAKLAKVMADLTTIPTS